MRTLVLITLFYGYTSLSLAQEEQLYDLSTDPMLAFEELNELIFSDQRAKLPCNSISNYDFQSSGNKPFKGLKKCSLERICRPIRENRNKLYLYKNSSGEVIPNPNAGLIEAELIGCGVSKEITLPELIDVDFEFSKEFGQHLLDSESDEDFKAYKENGELDFDILSKHGVFGSYKEDLLRKLVENYNRMQRYKKQREIRSAKYIDKFSDAQLKSLFNSPAQLKNLYPFFTKKTKDKLREFYNEGQVKFKKAFNSVKSDFNIILDKREGEVSSKVVDDLKNRISTITFENFSFDEYLKSDDCPTTNASYSVIGHKVMMCPQFLLFPEATISSVMAHELAHSIDPCQLSFSLLKAKNPDYSEVLTVDRFYHLSKGEAKDRVKKVNEGYSPKIGPFREELSCLEGFFNSRIRVNTKPMVRRQLAESINSLKSGIDFYSGSDNKQIVDLFKKDLKLKEELIKDTADFDRYRHCTIVRRYSPDGGEVFSDLMSSEIMALQISRLPKEKRREASYESFGLFIDNLCLKSEDAVSLEHESFIKKNECKTTLGRPVEKSFWQKAQEKFRGDHYQFQHQDEESRIEKIFLRHPELSRNLGCKKTGEYCGK